jgi:phage anti-repressor protein
MEKHNQFIIPESINFTELIKNNESILGLSEEYQCKMINELNTEFTEQEQRWYIANFYIYMNYHSTNDYPINLEDVFKMIGFANKGNAKRTLKNNFTKDEDYKITVSPKDNGKFTEEIIMLNIDTFKNLCMLARTEKGIEIRKYYIKLENIYNKIVKEERENMQKLLKDQEQNYIQDKENTLLESFHNKCVVYLILIAGILYKFGNTDNIQKRLKDHKREIGQDIRLIWCIESKNNLLLENKLKSYLKTTNLRKEKTFNNKIQTELIETNDIFNIKKKVKDFKENIELILQYQERIEELEKELAEYKKKDSNKYFTQEYYTEYINQYYDFDIKSNFRITTPDLMSHFLKTLENTEYKNKINELYNTNKYTAHTFFYKLDFKTEILNHVSKMFNIKAKDYRYKDTERVTKYIMTFNGLKIKNTFFSTFFENQVYLDFFDQKIEKGSVTDKVKTKDILDYFIVYLHSKNINTINILNAKNISNYGYHLGFKKQFVNLFIDYFKVKEQRLHFDKKSIRGFYFIKLK